MKRFILVLSLLISSIAFAQHKPLKHIEISDFPSNKISVSVDNNLANTINSYSASSLLARIRIVHEIGIRIPDLDINQYYLSVNLDNEEAKRLILYAKLKGEPDGVRFGVSPIILNIGELKYTIKSWAISDKHLMIDIAKEITEHISISGFQDICIGNNYIVLFDDHEQELWRRCAEKVYDNRKHF